MEFPAVAPTAMLFVRCGNNGISHHPDETMTAEDADIATSVLLHFFEHYRAHERRSSSAMTTTLERWIDAHHAEQIEFLRADRPRAVRHAARRQRAGGGESGGAADGARLRRRAPSGAGRIPARLRNAQRHQPDRAPALRRRRPDDRAERARRRRAARRRLDEAAVRGRGRERPHVRRAALPCRSPTSRRTRTRWRRCARSRRAARALNGTVELHFTYDEEFGGLAGPGFLLDTS